MTQDGELGVAEYVRHLTRDGARPEMGPAVFSAELRALEPAAAGRLCADRTHAFLTALAGAPAVLDTQ